jgi:glycosyltransferase involved in cell wall biosynthesis/putative flippase GtrA
MPAQRRRVLPVLDVVIPAFNEQADLASCVRRLHAYLTDEVPYPFRITIADSASTDATPLVAQQLAAELAGVRVLPLVEKGKGLAVRTAWSRSEAQVLVYMDVDLSTDLAGLLPLIAPLVSGHSDLAIGTRLHRSARVVRGPKREVISRSYNLLLRGALATRFSDAQCGFKAIRADVARALLPLVRDNGWFFDAELLVLADRAGLRIHEIPVDWVDDLGTTVNIRSAAVDDLRGILRMVMMGVRGRLPVHDLTAQFSRRRPGPDLPGVPTALAGHLFRFVTVGLLSTLGFLGLFLGLRHPLGGQVANAVALSLTVLGNSALNRRYTFGIVGRSDLTRHQLRCLATFCVQLTLTSAALGVVGQVRPGSQSWEVVALLAVHATATVARFLHLRHWVFRASWPLPRSVPSEALAPAPGAPQIGFPR